MSPQGAYTNQMIEQEDLLEQILSSASHAPTGMNTQPWKMAVSTGFEHR